MNTQPSSYENDEQSELKNTIVSHIRSLEIQPALEKGDNFIYKSINDRCWRGNYPDVGFESIQNFPQYYLIGKKVVLLAHMEQEKEKISEFPIPEGYRVMFTPWSSDGHVAFACISEKPETDNDGNNFWIHRNYYDGTLLKESKLPHNRSDATTITGTDRCVFFSNDNKFYITNEHIAKKLSIRYEGDGKLKVNGSIWKNSVEGVLSGDAKIHVFSDSCVAVINEKGSVLQNDQEWIHSMKQLHGNEHYIWGKDKTSAKIIINDKVWCENEEIFSLPVLNNNGDFYLINGKKIFVGHVANNKLSEPWTSTFKEISTAAISENGNVAVVGVEEGKIGFSVFINNILVEDLLNNAPVEKLLGMKFEGETLRIAYKNIENKYVFLSVPITEEFNSKALHKEKAKKFSDDMAQLGEALNKKGIDPAEVLTNIDSLQKKLESTHNELSNTKNLLNEKMNHILNLNQNTSTLSENIKKKDEQLENTQELLERKDKEIEELKSDLQKEKTEKQRFEEVIDQISSYLNDRKVSFFGKKKIDEEDLQRILDQVKTRSL